MRTITFYSYKGGVGRTLAAANFAVYLANLGLKTVVIDFDLEAPGIDAKFPSLELPEDQKGILDYILNYQLKKDEPVTLEEICLQVPIESSESNPPLWLIPAGQYLSDEYYRKLSQLDWSLIFSEERNGVAFFQHFLAQIEHELKADFVIIDSRTGITEIAGICTQQLADEVIMLSSRSRESIKVTKHIKELIKNSNVAKALEKFIDVKVVVSRVPKPDDLEEFKRKCCKDFEIEETNLFFLFSCQILEEEEFLAITASDKDEELVTNYVRLFYGMKIDFADQNIRAEIKQTTNQILLVTPEEAEKKVLGLVALYPHPEAYRAAMYFFRLVKKTEEMRNFAWKLLDLLPNDEEAQNILAYSYLSVPGVWRISGFDKLKAIQAIEPLWQRGSLNYQQLILYADMLENVERYSDSLKVVLPLCDDEQLDDKAQIQVRSIAARSAMKLGKREVAEKLIEGIPQYKLNSSLALVAIDIREKDGDIEGAFEIAKQVLLRSFSPSLFKKTVSIARQFDRTEELEELLRSSEEAQMWLRRDSRARKEVKQLALPGFADYFAEEESVDF